MELELMLRRFVSDGPGAGILGSWVARNVHLQVGITWADLPATGHAPTGEDLGAVVVRVRPIVKEKWSDQYGHLGPWRPCRFVEWRKGFLSLQPVIIARKCGYI